MEYAIDLPRDLLCFGARFGSLDIDLSKYLPQDIFQFLFD